MISFMLLSIILILLICALVKYQFQYFKRLNIFYIKPYFPFGNLIDFYIQRIWLIRLFDKWYKETEKHNLNAFGIFNLVQPLLVIKDPEIVKQCLIKDFSSFHDRGWKCDLNFEPLAGNLFILEGEKWRSIKKKLSPTFTIHKVKTMFHIFKEKSHELIYFLEDKSDIDIEIHDLFERFLTDIIATCAFGVKCNSIRDPNNEFHQMGKKLVSSSSTQYILEALDMIDLRLRGYLGLRFFDYEVELNFTQIVKDVIEFREKNNVSINDFLELMIKMRNKSKNNCETNESISILECAAHSFGFFFSGFQVSSSLISFVIYELAMNPEVQKLAQQEIDEVYENSGYLTYECLNEMKYLDRIVKGIKNFEHFLWIILNFFCFISLSVKYEYII